GNALPNPATLFAALALLVVLLSGLLHAMGVSVVNPATKDAVNVVSLMTVEGLHRMLTNAVTNFSGFAPIGTVLVAILGIAVAECAVNVVRLVTVEGLHRMLTSALTNSSGFAPNGTG